jgi:ABC-type sugar transport system ATPase subunit
VAGVRQGSFLHDISFELHKGEVVGLAGLVGAGRSRLLKVLAGWLPIAGGEMTLSGRRYRPRSPADAIRARVGLMSEDRKRDGLFLEMSLAKNISIVRPPARAKLIVWSRDERRLAYRWIDRLRIVPPRPGARAATFSGGNQQKALLGRWLHAAVDVLLIDEPGQGVDVQGKAEIARIVKEAAAQGKAVLVASSEADELFSMVDRILVMRAGRIVAEIAGPPFSEEHIVALASGAV